MVSKGYQMAKMIVFRLSREVALTWDLAEINIYLSVRKQDINSLRAVQHKHTYLIKTL